MTYVVRWGILYVAILTSSSSNLINFNRIFITHWKWSPNWFDKLKTILYKNKICSHKQICTITNVNLVVVSIARAKEVTFWIHITYYSRTTVFFFWFTMRSKHGPLKIAESTRHDSSLFSITTLIFRAKLQRGYFSTHKNMSGVNVFSTIKNNNCKLKSRYVCSIKNKYYIY